MFSRNLSHSYFFCWHFTLIVVSLTVVHPIYSMIIILALLHMVIWVFGLIGNWCCIICLSYLFTLVLLEVQGSTLTNGARALSKHVERSSQGYWGAFKGSGQFPLIMALSSCILTMKVNMISNHLSIMQKS